MKQHLPSILSLLLASSTSISLADDPTQRPWGYVPEDKNITPEQIQALYQKGSPKLYTAKDHPYASMPCGGIGAGQVEIQSCGKIIFYEDLYNSIQVPCGGVGNANGYEYMHPQTEQSFIDNGLAIAYTDKDGKTHTLPLTSEGFDNISMVGQYPIAFLNYGAPKADLPIEISSRVYTSYVPSDVRKSANPMFMVQLHLTNTSQETQEIKLGGWMKGVAMKGKEQAVAYQNQAHQEKGLSSLSNTMQLKNAETDAALENDNFWGDTSLSILSDEDVHFTPNFENIEQLFNARECTKTKAIDAPTRGGLYQNITLKAGESKEVTLVFSWYFANRDEYFVDNNGAALLPQVSPGRVGRVYSNWYKSSLDVAKYVAANAPQIEAETMTFHQAYHDNSLPNWLSNRIIMSTSTLACANINIWENGRFYALEGVTFCPGTCGHVYNFVASPAQLFPSLERSVRTMQDFKLDVGYNTSGRINFRGHGPGDEVDHRWASDAQSGYILKAYREHLMSKDMSFLDSVWEQVKMAIGYQIFKDGAEIGLTPNGVLECEQTFWDPMWYGPNPYNNTLYLAALRAAEEMARLKNEPQLADLYHNLYLQGRDYMSSIMWNGEYYAHMYPNGMTPKLGVCNGSKTQEEVDILAENYIKSFNQGNPTYYVSTACDANQLFGQNWAHQLALGDILPVDYSKIAMQSVFKYNFTPDIGTVYDVAQPWRVLASREQEEGALINGSWPKQAPKEFENTHDKSDIWSGLEYDAICNMINAGLMDEALIVTKAIDERYDGHKRNPWNEIEGSDHYSRAMQAWNILRSISGQQYNGPEGKLRFSPCLQANNFKCFYSVAEGWGSYSQLNEGGQVRYQLEQKYGQVRLSQLILPALEGNASYSISINGQEVKTSIHENNGQLILSWQNSITLKAGETLCIQKQ